MGKYTRESFIEKANETHNFKYDYAKVNFVDRLTKIIIICPKHGEFIQTPSDHLAGCGCVFCSGNKINLNIFIERSNDIHKNKYDYSESIYVRNSIKLKIICPEHGIFEQRASAHIGKQRQGCPYCRESKGEVDICALLKNSSVEFVRQHSFIDCKNIIELSFDFYIPKTNTCIEFNGEQHYFPIECFGGEVALLKQNKRDKIKLEYCKSNNIPFLVIKYDENIQEKLINFGILKKESD